MENWNARYFIGLSGYPKLELLLKYLAVVMCDKMGLAIDNKWCYRIFQQDDEGSSLTIRWRGEQRKRRKNASLSTDIQKKLILVTENTRKFCQDSARNSGFVGCVVPAAPKPDRQDPSPVGEVKERRLKEYLWGRKNDRVLCSRKIFSHVRFVFNVCKLSLTSYVT